MTVAALHAEFALADRLRVVAGPGGFPMIEVNTDKARATVSVYGGQVLSFTPNGADDLLFLSPAAYFAPGKAIKGGVPVCWPWFGADPDGKGRPAHGFARNRLWRLRRTEALDNGDVRIVLGFTDDTDSRTLWPQAFDVELTITIATTLHLALRTKNKGDAPFPLTQALHTYLAVGDIAGVRIGGLDGLEYIDHVDGQRPKRQQGDITITGSTDRVYQGVGSPLTIDDTNAKRRITITTEGSTSAVVWNPWIDIAKAMNDLTDDAYKTMLCVETANAGNDVITVAPGGCHTLAARYALAGL